MLSILIPTYDFTCYSLVADLHQQAETLGIPYEIIVAEDGSRSQVDIIANHKIEELSHCHHHIRKENIGLASTRNELVTIAQYEWLLIIDSDAVVEKLDFLRTYIQAIGKAEVVVGGLYHQKENLDPHKSLRFKYEKKADLHRNATERNQHPYSRLSCFNIMLHKDLFKQVQFDKDCKDYGYEDALFGVELALKSLNGRMEGHSYVENTYKKLCRWHLAWMVRLFYHLMGGIMRSNLCSRNPSLLCFSLYKLCYYATL